MLERGEGALGRDFVFLCVLWLFFYPLFSITITITIICGSSISQFPIPDWRDGACLGGADRDRTDDLLNAIQALFLLSYGPMQD